MMGNDPGSEVQKRTIYNRYAGDRMATVRNRDIYVSKASNSQSITNYYSDYTLISEYFTLRCISKMQ